MTKEEILQEFSDINHVYNNCTKYDTLKRMLEELTEENTGHWIPIPYQLEYETDAKCSLCKAWIVDGIDYKYCPKCGAKM